MEMTKARIKELFASMLQQDTEKIADESTPQEIPQWDSMQHMIIVASAEEEFNIDIDPEEIVDMYESYYKFESIILTKLS